MTVADVVGESLKLSLLDSEMLFVSESEGEEESLSEYDQVFEPEYETVREGVGESVKV